jgi:FixJ family two-component response regulator
MTPADRTTAAVREDAGWVFVVDDEAPVRRALTRLLRAAGYQVAAFPTAAEFLREAGTDGCPCCVLTDLMMPGLSGLDLQAALRARGVEMPIVFLSGHGEVSDGVRAMKEGAVDFLQKPVPEDELLATIATAHARDLEWRAGRAQRRQLETRLARLTPREREVLALVVTGLGNKQVGFELGASEKTIKVHRGRVMEKMEAGSLAELVRMADVLDVRPPKRSSA